MPRRNFAPTVTALEARLPLDGSGSLGSGDMTSTPPLDPLPVPVPALVSAAEGEDYIQQRSRDTAAALDLFFSR